MPIIPVPLPLPFPLINGNYYQHSSIELRMGGATFGGVETIDYDRTRTREMVEANSVDPLGKTQGNNKYTAKIKLYLPHFNQFIATLGIGYGDVPVLVIVTYKANGIDTITDTILGGTVDTTKATSSKGPAALSREFELNPTKILFNGVDDVSPFNLPALPF